MRFRRGGKKIKNNRGMRYNSKDYSNPFFDKKRKTNKKNKKFKSIKIIFILFVVTIVSALWFFIYSDYFSIKNINVTNSSDVGVMLVNQDDLKQMAQNDVDSGFLVILPKKNIFLFNTDDLKNKFDEVYSFDYLKITKKLPDSLEIEYVERNYSLIWLEDDRYYYMDEDGYIALSLEEGEIIYKKYPVMQNLSNLKLSDNKTPVEKKYLDYGLKLFEKLGEYGEFEIDKFFIDNETDSIKVILKKGPMVYFNTEADIDKQITKLIVIKQELKNYFDEKLYIDLRIGESVYYK
ncbi:MAG: hypothetical protein ABH881_03960 [bacterium]